MASTKNLCYYYYIIIMQLLNLRLCVIDLSALPLARKSGVFCQFYCCQGTAIFTRMHA